jgi:hypothetical protein
MSMTMNTDAEQGAGSAEMICTRGSNPPAEAAITTKAVITRLTHYLRRSSRGYRGQRYGETVGR